MCTEEFTGGMTRRRFIACSVGALASLVSPAALARASRATHRSLAFRNLHTGEQAAVTYWEHGEYLPDGLEEIYRVLRDHRSNDVHPIDTGLLDTLSTLKSSLEFNAPYEVISAYRSPETNEMLRRQGRAVAKRSMHTEGKAIDVRVPGQNLKQMRRAATALRAGGVGYYSRSGFLHLDVGRVRTW